MKKIILIVCAVVVVIGLLIAAGLVAYLYHGQNPLLTKPPEHGASFVIQPDLSGADHGTNDPALLKEAILRRASKAGVGIYWESISESRIRVLAVSRSSSDFQHIQSTLFRHGMLELRLVHEASDKLVESGEVPSDYEILKRENAKPEGQQRIEQIVVKRKAEPGLDRNLIERAMVMRGNLGEPEISLIMRPEAAAAFGKVTGENLGRRLAIVLDGKLYSAPVIQSPITGGRAVITGQFTMSEAFDLANAMDCPLPVSIVVLESKDY